MWGNLNYGIVQKFKSTCGPFMTKNLSIRHTEPSLIFSMDDEPVQPSPRLFELALSAVNKARSVDLSLVSKRMKAPPFYPDVWPGEHYKLLAGLVQIMQPKVVLEIGTSTGLSALALKYFLPKEGRLYTFDILPWNEFEETVLTESDFADERLIQYTDDLTELGGILTHEELLKSADLIFIDAAKDGKCEPKLIDNLSNIKFKSPPLVVFDDIRLMNMVHIWRIIPYPKLDITSFGHWSGTGLVDWISQ